MMQTVRSVSRSMGSARRMFATAQSSHVTYNDMKKTKHDFVHFVNTAMKDRKSMEAKELYHYLNKCFCDNDTDYDGLVSYRGFNAMIAEAALAPRRFGFAPHTREMYKSAEEYDLARTELFNKLKSSDTKRITMDSWMKWAFAHVAEKVGSGLAEHDLSKWERSKEKCVEFHKQVTKQGSSHCRRSSTSTQIKEFYMMQNDMFMACNKTMDGLLDKSQFESLVKMANGIPGKFGMDWYAGVKFEDVAKNNKVGWKEWKEPALKTVAAGASKA